MKQGILFLITLAIYSCGHEIGFKNPSQVSLTMQEAKDRKLFITEYKIIGIKTFTKFHSFPIDSVWKERAWHIGLDKSGEEIGVIDTPIHYNIALSLNNKDVFFASKNASNKWIIAGRNDTLLSGLECNMVFIPLYDFDVKDTVTLSIYEMKEPNDFKNNITPLFQFTIQRKE